MNMKKSYYSFTHFYTLAFLVFFVASCTENANPITEKKSTIFPTSNVDVKAVSSLISDKLNGHDTLFIGKLDTTYNEKLLHEKIKTFYQSNNYNPIWISSEGINILSEGFIKSIDSLKYDGLNPADYAISSQIDNFEKFKSGSGLNADDWMQFELAMTKSFFKASHDMVLGKLYELNKNNKNWKNKNDSTFDEILALKKSLASEEFAEAFAFMRPHHPWYTAFRNEYIRLEEVNGLGDMNSNTSLKDSIAVGFVSPDIRSLRKKLCAANKETSTIDNDTCDEKMLESIKTFQFRHQLKVTGILDTSTLKRLNQGTNDKQKKLAINMERLRWLSHDFAQPYIWADLPQMEVTYVEKDSVKFRMRTVIGRPTRATPTLDTKLENIVLSPPWVVPPTILKEDVLPGMLRRGGSYLARKGLKAYDRRGRPVSGNQINGSNYKKFSYSQAPGYRSSLGEVKFNMPNPWSIYMHDTPHREDFVKAYRAYSSGCVRVHKPKEFATFLLNDTINYSYSKVDSICKTRKTKFIPMSQKNINVHFVYLTTALDSIGNVMYLKDVYSWDDKIIGMK